MELNLKQNYLQISLDHLAHLIYCTISSVRVDGFLPVITGGRIIAKITKWKTFGSTCLHACMCMWVYCIQHLWTCKEHECLLHTLCLIVGMM